MEVNKSGVRILCVGDPHFQTKTIRETNKMEAALLELVEEVDLLVILGDVNHKHSQLDINNNMRVTKFLTSLAKKIPTYVLVGNHDIANNEQFLPEAHSLFSLKFCSSLNIIDRPTFIIFQGIKISLVPYLPVGRFSEGLEMIDAWEQSDIIFCHQEVRGVQLSKTMASDNGDVWSEDLPLLVCGHIHTYQRLADNIVYVGTPYSQNFAELDWKTVSIFTKCEQEDDNSNREDIINDENNDKAMPATDQIKSASSLRGWSEERVDLGIPGRLQISCPVSELSTNSDILQLLNINHHPDTKIKLRVRGTNDQLKHIEKLPVIINLKEKYRLVVEKINLEVFKPLEYEESESFEDSFQSYLQNLNLDRLIPIFQDYILPLDLE